MRWPSVPGELTREEAEPAGRGAADSSSRASAIWVRTRRPRRRTSGPADCGTTVCSSLPSHPPRPQVPGPRSPVYDGRQARAVSTGACKGKWAARLARNGRGRGRAEGRGCPSGGGHCTSGSRSARAAESSCPLALLFVLRAAEWGCKRLPGAQPSPNRWLKSHSPSHCGVRGKWAVCCLAPAGLCKP